MSEVAVDIPAGGVDNSTTITFPTDSRVRDLNLTLRADQNLHYMTIEADRGMAEAWASMLMMSEEDRQAMGLSARKRISSLFSIDAVTGRYEKLYSELANNIH